MPHPVLSSVAECEEEVVPQPDRGGAEWVQVIVGVAIPAKIFDKLFLFCSKSGDNVRDGENNLTNTDIKVGRELEKNSGDRAVESY